MGLDLRRQSRQRDANWTGNFPTSLGGTSVTIDGKSAYLWYVSPTQINLQVPDDATTGSVPVVVTTAGGGSVSTVTLAAFAPSFSLLDGKHVAGIIIRSDGSGAYGGGTYDILGPTGSSLGYPTVAAKAGDTVELFGVGFGPTTPTVPRGRGIFRSGIHNEPRDSEHQQRERVAVFRGGVERRPVPAQRHNPARSGYRRRLASGIRGRRADAGRGDFTAIGVRIECWRRIELDDLVGRLLQRGRG